MRITLPLQLGIALSILLIAGAVALFVPPDMDIFIQFQPLACAFHPFNLSPCRDWDLTVAGFLHWPRSSDFQGLGGYSLFYFPLYALLPVWQSALLLNALWMTLTVWFFIRLTGVNAWIAAFMFGANFFFVYNTIHDYQINYNMTLMLGVPWMIAHILEARSWRRRVLWNALLGTSVFLAIEYKPVFLYYLPASCLLALFLGEHKPRFAVRAQDILWKCLPAILFVEIATIVMLFARLPDGRHYWMLLEDMRRHYQTFAEIAPYLEHLRQLAATYLLNFHNSGGITFGPAQDLVLMKAPFDVRNALITAPFWLITGGLYAAFLHQAKNDASQKAQRRTVLTLLAAGFLTFMLVGLNSKTRHAFHLIPVMVFWLGGAAICMDALYRRHRWVPWIGGLLAASQIFCTVAVVSQTPLAGYGWTRFPALDYAAQPSIAARSMMVHLDWGTYFIGSLYGPKEQMVTSRERLGNREELRRLIRTARRHGRYMAFLRRADTGADFAMIREELPRLVKLFPPRKSAREEWEVWGEAELLRP